MPTVKSTTTMEYTNEIRLSGRASSVPTEQAEEGDSAIQFPLSCNETVVLEGGKEVIKTHWFRIKTKDKALIDKIRDLNIAFGDNVLVTGSLAQDSYKGANGIDHPGIRIDVKDVQILKKAKP